MDNQHPNQIIEDLYIKEKKSILNIAETLNLSYSKVYSYLNDKDLIRRKKPKYDKLFFEKLENYYYNEKLSLKEIAIKLNLNNGKVVKKILNDNNYKLRKTDSEILLNKIGGKDNLFNLYIKENKSPQEIANMYNSTIGRINILIKKFDFQKEEVKMKESWKRNYTKACYEKYKVEFPFQNKEYLDYVNKIARDKYDVPKNIFQSEIVKEKSRKTIKRKYNVSHYSKTKTFKKEIKETLRKNELKKYTSLGKKVLINNKEFKDFLDENPKKYSLIELSILFGCSTKSLRTIISQTFPKKSFMDIRKKYLKIKESKWETLFKLFLKDYFPDLNYSFQERNILDKKEIDFYIPELNLGIEINPLYTHKYKNNSIGKDFYYHINKTKEALEKNIKLIHVWEHDFNDLNIIKESIKSNILLIDNKYISKDKYTKEEVEREYKIIDFYYLYYYLDKNDLNIKKIITKEKLKKIDSYGFIVTSGVWEVQRM